MLRSFETKGSRLFVRQAGRVNVEGKNSHALKACPIAAKTDVTSPWYSPACEISEARQQTRVWDGSRADTVQRRRRVGTEVMYVVRSGSGFQGNIPLYYVNTGLPTRPLYVNDRRRLSQKRPEYGGKSFEERVVRSYALEDTRSVQL